MTKEEIVNFVNGATNESIVKEKSMVQLRSMHLTLFNVAPLSYYKKLDVVKDIRQYVRIINMEASYKNIKV